MINADIVNGGFELGAGLAMALNCRRIWLDKKALGLSIWASAFFTAWGLWNLYYYPSLLQPVSFVGGWLVCAANLLYLSLLLRYRTNK